MFDVQYARFEGRKVDVSREKTLLHHGKDDCKTQHSHRSIEEVRERGSLNSYGRKVTIQ